MIAINANSVTTVLIRSQVDAEIVKVCDQCRATALQPELIVTRPGEDNLILVTLKSQDDWESVREIWQEAMQLRIRGRLNKTV